MEPLRSFYWMGQKIEFHFVREVKGAALYYQYVPDDELGDWDPASGEERPKILVFSLSDHTLKG